jgi:hypothetical protein
MAKRDELIALWLELEKRLNAAFEVVSKLDDEESGPRQFASCIMASELLGHIKASQRAREMLIASCEGCGGSGRVPSSLARCPWCQPTAQPEA